jgi:hypothetical protein
MLKNRCWKIFGTQYEGLKTTLSIPTYSNYIYCHVFMAPWLIITDFGLDLLAPYFTMTLITINYNNSQSIFSRTLLSWLPRTRSILFLILRLTQIWFLIRFCTTYILSRRTHRKHHFCCQECVFIGPLPSNGCYLLSLIVVRITQQRAVYQESASVGTFLSSRYLAVGRYVTIFWRSCYSSSHP